MKPLTIEQLKSLDIGDWVWVITEHYSRYVWIFNTEGECLHYQYSDIENRVLTLSYSDYGTKWLAYKNKEQAEAKGEIVELIAPLDSELWEIECPKHKDDKGNIWTSLTYKDAKVVKSKYKLSLSNYDMLLKGYYFLTKQEAERRLAELRGEKV